MTTNDGSASILCLAARFTQLDAAGNIVSGANMYVTDQIMKVDIAPAMESGQEATLVNGAARGVGHFKAGDFEKYRTVTIGMTVPDPELTALITGGTILTDTTSALTAPSAPTAVSASSGGTLPAASYVYRIAAENLYGATLASAASAPAVVTSSTGSVTLTWTESAGDTDGTLVYGRIAGKEQLLVRLPKGTTTWTDTGALTPSGAQPASNTTAGPGVVGYQAPALLTVGNPNGVAMELWAQAQLGAKRAPQFPFRRRVLPLVMNAHEDTQSMDTAFMVNQIIGEAYENPNFGTGPRSDWPLDSSRVSQWSRCASLPTNIQLGMQTV